MKGSPRIRALMPARFQKIAPLLPVSTRAGDAPQVFRQFARTLGKLERAAGARRPGNQGDGA